MHCKYLMCLIIRNSCTTTEKEKDGNLHDPSSVDSPEAPCGPGRKCSKYFAFEDAHPLCKHYVQKIREKFLVPIRAGGSRPTFPKPVEPDSTPSAAWIYLNSVACEFYSSNFMPWSTLVTPRISSAEFRRWVHEQHILFKNSESPFEDRLIACGRMKEFRNYAFLGQLNKQDVQMSRQYRQRNRKIWSDEELNSFFQSCGGDEGKKAAEDEVEKLRKRQEARKTDIRRMHTAEVNEEWVNTLTTDASALFGDIPSSSPSQTFGLEITVPLLSSLQSSLNRIHKSPRASEVKETAENLYDDQGFIFSLYFSFSF